MSTTYNEDQLVKRLLDLSPEKDRGALAALRTGLGKRPGDAPRMFPFVVPYLSTSDSSEPSVIAAFLTASLFAKHPKHRSGDSLGAALWGATKREQNPDGKHLEAGVESRFTAMLDADVEDLPRHLEGLVSLCESAEVGLDWYRFRRDVEDLLYSENDRRDWTLMRWAKDFWKGPDPKTTSSSQGQDK
jgi:CRISPR system Cascade subunit CasB